MASMIKKTSSDSFYGENKNGFNVSILDGGSSDINFYRYGSKRIWEVTTRTPDGTSNTSIATTKSEAMSIGNKYLESNSQISSRGIGGTSTSTTGN